MRRSHNRRGVSWISGRRKVVAAVATLVAFGGIITVTQVSNASTRPSDSALAACDKVKAPSANQSKFSTETPRGTYKTNGGRVTNFADDGQEAPTAAQMRQRCRDSLAASTKAGKGKGRGNNGGNNNGGNNNGGGGGNGGGNNGQQAVEPGAGLGVLARDCSKTKLQLHDGFQAGNRCVTTEFGEVSAADKNPTLLITSAPTQVAVGQAFTLKVSTRNLRRDRFLGAAAGGYYVESSLLDGNGDQRGHFHTACRMLANPNEAPPPADVPAFFVASEDGQGGSTPDTVTIQVPGLPQNGQAQCASWAGDGSHRIPMMEKANEIAAFDSVRIQVGGGGGGGNNVKSGTGQGRGNNNVAGLRISCPGVGNKLGQVPAAAQNEVSRNLALLDTQIQEAQNRINNNGTEGGKNFINNAVLQPLAGKRGSTIDRIRLAIQRAGGQAPNLGGLAACTAA